jgi:acetolactate synthase-1/2/3 large subunit
MSTSVKRAMNQTNSAAAVQTGAEFLVTNLESKGVEYVFGIPGAKLDKLFDTLVDSKIKTVLCRQEQNAAFIAAGIGRMTGKAGVCIGPSGPGCSNLMTGLATATAEGIRWLRWAERRRWPTGSSVCIRRWTRFRSSSL